MGSPLPLTTIFTQPASCSSLTSINGVIFRGLVSGSVGDAACYPQSFSSRAYEYYYSPGVCPSGWINAGNVTGTGALETNTAETNIQCCPPNYYTGPEPYCGSRLTGIVTGVVLGGTTTIDPATLAQPTAWADIIQVRWQVTDSAVLSIMSSTISTSTTDLTTSPTNPSISTAASSTTPQTGQTATNRNHLSSSAEASIGIGVSVFIIAVAALVWLLVPRRKRQKGSVEMRQSDLDVPLRPEYRHELSAQHAMAPLPELDNGRNAQSIRQEPVELMAH